MKTLSIPIARIDAEALEARLEEFALLLRDCVEAGASVNFILPFLLEESREFWRARVLPAARRGGLLLLAAEEEGHIVGSVQLNHETPPNQQHRAEVNKLLVHPAFRRRGIARALMGELERQAAGIGRSLLTLDTRTGDSAEPLYRSMGYQTVGIIPDYCRDTIEERLDPTTIMYKRV